MNTPALKRNQRKIKLLTSFKLECTAFIQKKLLILLDEEHFRIFVTRYRLFYDITNPELRSF